MEITEARLRANGWVFWIEHNGDEEIPCYEKELSESFSMRYKCGMVYLLLDRCSCELPRVRTLEALAQLEWLLSDTYQASIETLPDFAQADARAVDRTLEELGVVR